MKKVIAAVLVNSLVLSALAASAPLQNKTVDFRLYGFGEHFEWKETVNGQQLLKESGPIFGAGGELSARISDPLWIEARGEFFLGDVDYDGNVQHSDGRLTPFKSTTSYTGFKLEGALAHRIPLNPDTHLKPYLGLGFRGWTRTLGTKLSDDRIGQYGYEERWLLSYGILGIGGAIAVSDRATLFAKAEARLPIYNSETVDLDNVGGPDDIELEPGKRASAYAEIGVNASPITFSVFVETLSFSESDLDDDHRSFFQPESKSTMIGAKFGIAF